KPKVSGVASCLSPAGGSGRFSGATATQPCLIAAGCFGRRFGLQFPRRIDRSRGARHISLLRTNLATRQELAALRAGATDESARAITTDYELLRRLIKIRGGDRSGVTTGAPRHAIVEGKGRSTFILHLRLFTHVIFHRGRRMTSASSA